MNNHLIVKVVILKIDFMLKNILKETISGYRCQREGERLGLFVL